MVRRKRARIARFGSTIALGEGMATTKAPRYTVQAIYTTGTVETLMSGVTERQACGKWTFQTATRRVVRESDGREMEVRGKHLAEIGAARREISVGAEAIARQTAGVRVGRETREQYADYVEDAMGDADRAERIRTGRGDIDR
jgi:hypothetical protein